MAPAVQAVGNDHRLDHLPDRKGLADIARSVFRQEPVEAEVRVVGALLLGVEQRETGLVGELGPSRVAVVAGGVLRATVQHHNERRAVREISGQIVSCLQRAGIGAEFSEGGQAIGGCESGGMRVS
jgi:hypothetical protein